MAGSLPAIQLSFSYIMVKWVRGRRECKKKSFPFLLALQCMLLENFLIPRLVTIYVTIVPIFLDKFHKFQPTLAIVSTITADSFTILTNYFDI